jgi:hypothetical protein
MLHRVLAHDEVRRLLGFYALQLVVCVLHIAVAKLMMAHLSILGACDTRKAQLHGYDQNLTCSAFHVCIPQLFSILLKLSSPSKSPSILTNSLYYLSKLDLVFAREACLQMKGV